MGRLSFGPSAVDVVAAVMRVTRASVATRPTDAIAPAAVRKRKLIQQGILVETTSGTWPNITMTVRSRNGSGGSRRMIIEIQRGKIKRTKAIPG